MYNFSVSEHRVECGVYGTGGWGEVRIHLARSSSLGDTTLMKLYIFYTHKAQAVD